MLGRRRSTKSLERKHKVSQSVRNIVILFADVMNSSEIANNLSLCEYYNFITNFQNCFREVCEFYENGIPDISMCCDTRGDEGCLKMIVPDNNELIAQAIDEAIRIAIDLKRTWLFTSYNEDRIEAKLLPNDLGIGIHSGKIFMDQDNKPQGYAINLAKRIESSSREGKYTRIHLSEAAQGQLYYLKDEPNYKFVDTPFVSGLKGITDVVKVFEIRHHYLHTEWQDMPSSSSIIFDKLEDKHVCTVGKACNINPASLWLGEECVMLTMMNAYRKFQNKEISELKKAYEPALEIVQRITAGHLRDGTLLAIYGYVLGEMERFREEEEKYIEAIKIEESDGDFHWYLALSISYQLKSLFDSQKLAISDFYEEHIKRICEIFEEFDRAQDLKPMSAWVEYDHACELSWWSQVEKSYSKIAKNTLIKVFRIMPDLVEHSRDEVYLQPIINSPEIKKFFTE